MSLPVLIAFLGALLSALGAILASIQQAKESEENSKLYKQLAEKSDTIATYAVKNEAKAEENNMLYRQLAGQSEEIKNKTDENAAKNEASGKKIQELQQSLIEKQEIQNRKTEEIAKLNANLVESQKEISRLSQNVTNYVTGGDSYCYVTILPGTDSSKLKIQAFHRGSYPLNIAEILISNTSQVDRVAGNNGPMRRSIGMFWRYGAPGFRDIYLSSSFYNSKVLGEINRPVGWLDNDQYHIEFQAVNGSWMQEYNRTTSKEKIIVKRDGKVIYER
jgi:hypothetical protein